MGRVKTAVTANRSSSPTVIAPAPTAPVTAPSFPVAVQPALVTTPPAPIISQAAPTPYNAIDSPFISSGPRLPPLYASAGYESARALRISLAARASNRRESPFTHLIIISEKRGGKKRSEKQCRKNLTSFHRTYYLVNQIIFPEQSFRPQLFP